MLIPLSDKVWWGDRFSITEQPTWFKAVINVSQNLEGDYWPRIGTIDQKIPYFRLALHDDEVVDDNWRANIDALLDMVDRNNWYPVLVHCMAGCHRSVATATYAEWRLQGGQNLEGIRAMVRSRLLNPGEGMYYNTLIGYCRHVEAEKAKAAVETDTPPPWVIPHR